MNRYRLPIAAEIFVIVAFLFFIFAIIQDGIFSAQTQFVDCVNNKFDHKAVLNRINGMNDPERFLQDLSSEFEAIPYEKTAAVINTQGVIAVLSSQRQDKDTELKLQRYTTTAQRAFLDSDFERTHWVKSKENNTSIRFDYYFLMNGRPTMLFVEFSLSPLKAVFLDDNFLFLVVETIFVFLFIQFAAFFLFFEYYRKKNQLEKSHSYFISGVAHEIKTPITEIISLTECASVVSSQDEKDRYLELIADCSEKMKAIVESFLKNSYYLSERKPIKTKISLSDAVRCKAAGFLPFFDKKSIVTNTDYTDPLVISADSQLINIVIDNFLSNALKYTGAGCCVKIKTYRRRKKAGFSIHNQTDLPVDVKSIWDSAFEPDKGTGRIHGMGLNLCKKILRLHRFRYGCRIEDGGVLFFFEAKLQSIKKG